MAKLFLSHAAGDSELAEFLERELHASIPGVSIFRTTRVGQIKAGKEWLAEIRDNILDADRFLILLTPRSKNRPWILFEAGAAWAQQKTLVPVVAAGLRKSEIPEPLASLQLLALEDPEEAAQAILDLGGVLNEATKFVGHVKQLGKIVREKAFEEEGWDFIEHAGTMYAWDGPLEDLVDGRPQPQEDSVLEALRAAGLQLVSAEPHDLARPYSKGYGEVYEVRNFKRKHTLIDRHGQILLAKRSPSAA